MSSAVRIRRDLFDIILQADNDLPITRSLYALFTQSVITQPANQRVVSEYRTQSVMNVLCMWGFDRALTEVVVLWDVRCQRVFLLPSSV